MNPLSSLLNLFRKKPSALAEANEKWMQGYHAFEAGRKYFTEQRNQEADKKALAYFDTAVECGLESAKLFGSRGCLLQTLEWHLDAIDDFTKAISLEPQDCNLYFQRAISKTSTGDSHGFLADIQEAIRLSKVDNALNRNYNLGAKNMGWQSNAALYEGYAEGVVAFSADLDFIKRKIERTKSRGKRKDKPQ